MKVILISFFVLFGYLIGSIPTGAWLARIYGRDITKYGSGNIGATNVGRLFGVSGFIVVFLLDCLKAYFYLLLLFINHVPENIILIVAMSVLIGNSYSIFLQGYGGKGVATSVGIMLVFAPFLFLVDFIFWLVFFGLTRTVGVASVAAYLSLPLISYFFRVGDIQFNMLILFMSIWGIYRHYDNIKKYMV